MHICSSVAQLDFSIKAVFFFFFKRCWGRVRAKHFGLSGLITTSKGFILIFGNYKKQIKLPAWCENFVKEKIVIFVLFLYVIKTYKFKSLQFGILSFKIIKILSCRDKCCALRCIRGAWRILLYYLYGCRQPYQFFDISALCQEGLSHYSL